MHRGVERAPWPAGGRDGNPLRLIVCGGAGERNGSVFGRLLGDATVEREIASDPMHRFFSTDARSFIVADMSGRGQGSREFVAEASAADADAAVMLVDANRGLLTQTRRHACLAGLTGIRKIVLVVEGIDRAGHAEQAFADIAAQFRGFAARLGLDDIVAIPLPALPGDDVAVAGPGIGWYRGPELLECLSTVPTSDQRARTGPLRLPVQSVRRTSVASGALEGTLVSGIANVGDRIRVQPAGCESRVALIVTAAGEQPRAVAGQSVSLTLADDLAISPGDVICTADDPAAVADQFQATLVWVGSEPMLPGRAYIFELGVQTALATITGLKHKLNVDSLEHVAARTLEPDEIGVCNVSLDRAVAFDAGPVGGDLSRFVLIDRQTDSTVAAGMLNFALRRAQNIHLQHVDVDKAARAAIKRQRPAVIWLTGLSGAGKSTIANLVEKKMLARGLHSYLLDGDNVRHGLNRDLGFTDADRVENIRRVAEVARLMVDAGLIVITAFISPFRAEREMARRLLERTGIHRSARACDARDGRATRPQGPVPEGSPRRAEQLHRHRLAVRSAADTRAVHRYRNDDRRSSG